MIEGDVAEGGNEHADEVKEGEVGQSSGSEANLAVGAVGRLGEEGMADGLPMFGRAIRMSRWAKEWGSQKEQGNGRRAGENDDWKDEQLFVAANDGERALH